MEDKPFKALCHELMTGHNYGGRLSVSDKRMRLKIVSFGQFFHLNHEQPIVVELENGKVATLIHCIPSSGARTSSHRHMINSEVLTPNIVLLGPDPWPADQLVRWARFGFLDSDTALLPTGIVESNFEYVPPPEGSTEEGASGVERDTIVVDYNKALVLKVRTAELELEVRMVVSRSIGQLKQLVELHPAVSIDFFAPQTVDEYLVTISQIVGFFALSIGRASRPHDIHINHATFAERMTQIENRSDRGDFEARYTWPAPMPKQDDLWVGGAVFQVLNADERAATSECLSAWLDRRNAWRPAYSLFPIVLRRANRVDRDRLLAAFAWFEAIPMRERSKDFSAKEITAMSDTAITELRRLRTSPNEDRVRSALARLNEESLTERVRRLIPTVRERFGDQVPARLEQDCIRAVRLRGSTAHGGLHDDSDAGFAQLLKAIYAVEFFSFLLMIRDLPLSPSVMTRLAHHPLAKYRHLV